MLLTLKHFRCAEDPFHFAHFQLQSHYRKSYRNLELYRENNFLITCLNVFFLSLLISLKDNLVLRGQMQRLFK